MKLMLYSAERMDSKIGLSMVVLPRSVILNDMWVRILRTLCFILMVWFTPLVLLFWTASTLAQTPVSGAIAVNSHWTTANSPYLISGDVSVQNGAVLDIDAGVSIYMGANASLSVQEGSIQAHGTLVDPITVLSDKTRLAQSAAPGDWKQWIFSPGTFNTCLEHVLFEHGSGLVIHGSAPVLNYIKINNHQGAAMSIDLAASPTGVGNEASGNDINGIAVPAGDIQGSIKWGLRGIPYYVDSGVVSVGASPRVTSIIPNIIQQGATIAIDITGSRLSGLASAQFDNTAMVAKILPGSTDTHARFSVNASTTAAIGSTLARFLVDAGEIEVADALTVVPTQPVLSSLYPSTLYLGQGMVDVIVSGTNFTSESTVQVNGGAVPTLFQSVIQLKASIDTPSSADYLHIRLQTPDSLNVGQDLMSNELLLPVVPGQLALSPSTITAFMGSNKTITLTLPYPAKAGGVTVDLVSSVPTVGSVPPSLTIPAGQSSASFTFNADNVGDTVITASKLGFISGQAQIAVVPAPTLTLEPTSLILGEGRNALVTIKSSIPAGKSGLSVNLSSSAPGVATVPASIVIPEGASSATFTVTTVAIGSATIQAIATEFASGSAAITVRPVSLNLPTNVLVAPGLTRSVPLVLSDPAPAGGLVVNLVGVNSAIATVPVSMTVPEGRTSTNFTLTGVAAGTTGINATAAGYQSASTAVSVESVSINIGNPPVNSISVPMGASHYYAITLSKPAPAGGVEIKLASENPAIATVLPASITIAEGQTSGGVNLARVAGAEIGTTTFSASSPGLSAASVPVTTINADLAFSASTVTVGKGLKNYSFEVYVYRKTGDGNYSPNQALTVNLVSSDAAKVSVPATVTIPAGSYYAYFQATGVDFTNGTPVTIDATADGYTPPATKLAVNTVAPVFNFSELDTDRSSISARDNFRFYVSTPGATYPNSQTAAADFQIDLAIASANPESIVDGFYSAQSAGTAVTQVRLRKDQTFSDYAFVGTPTTIGSYQVRASAMGVTTATSAVVTVKAPELRFSATRVTVGKGLKNYSFEVYVYRAVNGTADAGSEALTINLDSSDKTKVSVPETVTIPAGSYYTYFQVAGVDFTNGTPVTIDATAAGYLSPATKLAVNTVAPVFNFSEVDIHRSPLSARDNVRLYVSVPGATYPSSQTAAGDLPIDLAIVNADPYDIVDGFYSAKTAGTSVTQVLLRKGETYSDYAYIGTPNTAGSYQVKSSAPGVTEATSAVVTVSAPELRVSQVNNATAVTVGKGLRTYYQEVKVTRVVNGTAFAGADAVTVNLISSDATKVNVPATVTIEAGQSYAYFQVSGVGFTNGTPVTIDATAAGYASPATKLAVNTVAPVIIFSEIDAIRSTASVRDKFRLYVTTPGAIYSSSQTAVDDLPIDLVFLNADPAGIVDGFYNAQTSGTAVTQVLLRKGETYSDYAYVGTPTMAGSYQVQASASGFVSGTSGLVTVGAPELKLIQVNNANAVTVGKGMRTYYQEVKASRVVNGIVFNGADAVTVNLTCSAAVICSVPASVTIPANSSAAYFQITGLELGNTTITASATGYNSPAQDLAANVVKPALNFNGPGNTFVGGKANFSVYLTVSGATYSGGQTAASSIMVSITSSTPAVANVPASLTVPLNGTISDVGQLTGIAAGTTTLTASGPDLQTATTSGITINP